jgi:hypothetical protein
MSKIIAPQVELQSIAPTRRGAVGVVPPDFQRFT